MGNFIYLFRIQLNANVVIFTELAVHSGNVLSRKDKCDAGSLIIWPKERIHVGSELSRQLTSFGTELNPNHFQHAQTETESIKML